MQKMDNGTPCSKPSTEVYWGRGRTKDCHRVGTCERETETETETERQEPTNETKSKYKSASLTLQHNVPKLLIYWPGYNMAIKKQTLPQHFEFLEINTNRYAEIPKSFIDFCKEQGIEPLEENEHLHYV